MDEEGMSKTPSLALVGAEKLERTAEATQLQVKVKQNNRNRG